MKPGNRILVTGATGLLGSEVVDRLLRTDPDMRLVVLVRDGARWAAEAARRRLPTARIEPLVGDVTMPGLGVEGSSLRHVSREVAAVIHLAGDVVFSRPLSEARETNLSGTRNVLDALDGRAVRFAHISTAFVAGRRTGVIEERAIDGREGWVNAYEQSKWEAEQLVRESCGDFVIIRPSTVVCDDGSGSVRQQNAVHRSLRLFHAGLAPMVPGAEDSPVDFVTAEYVADGITRVVLRPELRGETLQLCAGTGATDLGTLLSLSFDFWSGDPAWRRRAIERPLLTDLTTYRAFESAVEETGDVRLIQVMRALSHFAPQLALPKRFDTSRATAVLGNPAPRVEEYWIRVLEHLRRQNRSRDAVRFAA